MTTPITNCKEAHTWQKRHEDSAPKVGDMAPDFELPELGRSGSVHLSQFRGERPVALLFGSYT